MLVKDPSEFLSIPEGKKLSTFTPNLDAALREN